MPRKPRFNLIGMPQHVIQRGNNRSSCFFAEYDYRCYLDHLKAVSHKYDCRIHAYILMTNHVHLLVTPMIDYGIPQMMQALGKRYVHYVNKTYQRTGTLWEGRYKSSLIDSDRYLFACMRYIELNPVRAKMVKHPGDYKWSSYQSNTQRIDNSVIEHHPLYRELGSTPEDRQTAYQKMFCRQIDNDTLQGIRDTLNHELALGNDRFKDKVEKLTHRQTRMGKPGRPGIREERAVYHVGYVKEY